MSDNTATLTKPTETTPTVHELWDSDSPVTGDYLADCVAFVRESLEHVGFDGFEEVPFADVIACHDHGVPVTVAVVALPSEEWETTLDDVERMVGDEERAKGAALCVARALSSDGPLPERMRFDVASACVNLEVGRVRVHHVRGVWQS